MSDFAKLAALAVQIDGYELRGRRENVSSDFERLSTEIVIHGAGEQGVGEDVTYDGVDQEALQAAGAEHDLTGAHTLGELCALVGELDI